MPLFFTVDNKELDHAGALTFEPALTDRVLLPSCDGGELVISAWSILEESSEGQDAALGRMERGIASSVPGRFRICAPGSWRLEVWLRRRLVVIVVVIERKLKLLYHLFSPSIS